VWKRAAPNDSVRLLGVFLAWHLLLNALVRLDPSGGPTGVIFFASFIGWTALVTLPRTFRIGLAGLFVAKLGLTIASLPMTSNHAFVETLLLALVLVQSSSPSSRPSGPDLRHRAWRAAELRETVLFVIAGTYALAGLQKLAQGYWHDGEFLALELVYGTGGLAHSMQVTFDAIAAAFGLEPVLADPRGLDVLAARPMPLPRWAATTVLALSWSFLALELLAPALLLWSRTRRAGLVLLAFVQIGIGMFAWETEFMCLALAGVALQGRHVGRNLALVLALEVSLAVMFAAAGVDR
jgi:hypothetical protein